MDPRTQQREPFARRHPVTAFLVLVFAIGIEPFPTGELAPYDPAFVRGWTVERYQLIIDLGVGLGLRQGEIFGLSLADIDLTIRRGDFDHLSYAGKPLPPSADGKTGSTSLFINGHSLRGMSKDVTGSDERVLELKEKMEAKKQG